MILYMLEEQDASAIENSLMSFVQSVYAFTMFWNQLPASFRQPQPNPNSPSLSILIPYSTKLISNSIITMHLSPFILLPFTFRTQNTPFPQIILTKDTTPLLHAPVHPSDCLHGLHDCSNLHGLLFCFPLFLLVRYVTIHVSFFFTTS